MKTRLLSILLLLNLAAFAQLSNSDSQYSVKTTLSKDAILIGDRVGLTISVLVPVSCRVTFPSLSDSLMKGIELVKKPIFETVKLKDNKNEQILKLFLTSFDSGSYQLPELKIAISDGSRTDTVLSKPLNLVVNNLPKDKAVKDIYDIKAPFGEPLTLKEVAPWAFGGILLAALIFLLVIYLKRRRENRPFSFLQKHIDPPHVVALRELEKIKQEKLYLSENHKYYYTRLIDTIRIYIEGKYEVNAMEQTTDEILFGLKQVGFPIDEQYIQLQDTLTLADLVKFAKYTPFVSDNENSLNVAFDFVEKTKPVEEAKEPVIAEVINQEDKKEVVQLTQEQDNKILS